MSNLLNLHKICRNPVGKQIGSKYSISSCFYLLNISSCLHFILSFLNPEFLHIHVRIINLHNRISTARLFL